MHVYPCTFTDRLPFCAMEMVLQTQSRMTSLCVGRLAYFRTGCAGLKMGLMEWSALLNAMPCGRVIENPHYRVH